MTLEQRTGPAQPRRPPREADSALDESAPSSARGSPGDEGEDEEGEDGAGGLTALEADLEAAEARVEAAEARYLRSRRQLARTAPVGEPPTAASGPTADMEAAREDAAVVDAAQAPSASQAARSAALERRALGLEDRGPPAREGVGQLQDRSIKADSRPGQPPGESHAAGPAHQPQQQRAPPQRPPPPLPEPAPDSDDHCEREPAALQEGAQSIADRLKRLQDGASGADKRASAVEVLTGGTESGYTFEPRDVVLDLQQRGLLEQGFAAELIQWLPPVAEVVGSDCITCGGGSSISERLSDRPFQDGEALFLRSFEERAIAAAESELVAAEAQLTEVVSQAAARLCLESIEPSKPKAPARSQHGQGEVRQHRHSCGSEER